MKRLCSLLCCTLFSSLFASELNTLSYAQRMQRPKDPSGLLEQAHKLSTSGDFGQAAKQFGSILDWHFPDEAITHKAGTGYIESLSRCLEQKGKKPIIKPADITRALNLCSQLHKDPSEPQVVTLLTKAPEQERKKFIEGLSLNNIFELSYSPQLAQADDELLMNLYRSRIEKETEWFDADARMGYAGIVLYKHRQTNEEVDPENVSQATQWLEEIFDHQPEQKTPDHVFAHRNAWNMLASEALHNQDYTDVAEYLLNSLFEEYNAHIEEDEYCFPTHTPFELCTIVSLLKEHESCQAKVDELTEQMTPEQKRWFLGTLFQTAWQAYGQLDAAWLLAQSEQQYGNLEGTRDILQELAKQEYPNAQTELQKMQRQLQLQAFASHVNDYSSGSIKPEAKEHLEKIIIDCMDDESRTSELLKLCPTNEQQQFVWKTIFNKAQNPAVRFNAAYHQALLTDSVPHKCMLFQMAVSNGIQKAIEPAFVLCNKIGCTELTKKLCSALAKHTPEKHTTIVSWLHLFQHNKQPAQELLKELGYSNRTKAMELTRAGAQAGWFNAQVALALFYAEQVYAKIETAKTAPVQYKNKKNSILDAHQQACDYYSKAAQLPDGTKEEKLQTHCQRAQMHLQLANMAKAKAEDVPNKAKQEEWRRFSHAELKAAREQLNLVLKADKNNARAHSQLGVIYMQDDQREKGIASLLKAFAIDPKYKNSFTRLLDICQEDLNKILKNLQQEVATNSKIKSHVENAKQLATKITKLDPDCHLAWTLLGACAETEGKQALAAKRYTQALEINPRYAQARYRLGLIQAAQGDDKKAVSNLQQAAQDGCTHSDHHLAEYMISGYGGYYNLPNAKRKLQRIKNAYRQSENKDSLQKADLHLKLAEYDNANYLGHKEDAITILQLYRNNADAATQAAIDCTCGMLNIHQTAEDQDCRKSKEHYEEGMSYLTKAIEHRDPHDLYTPRNIYFYTSVLTRPYLYRPYNELDNTQQKTLAKAIELLEYITHDIAKVQPHNFFVGKAHELLGDIQLNVHKNKKDAQSEYEKGAHIGHMGCALKLARSYETGTLTADGQDNLEKAREVLETAVKKGDSKLKQYETAQRDLWVFNRELGIENTNKDASMFLQTFDILKKMDQENKYTSRARFFSTWHKMNKGEKIECSSHLMNSKLPKDHNCYELRQQFRESFHHSKILDAQELHTRLNELCAEWNQFSEKERKELPFSSEDRNALYARIQNL